MSSGEQESRCDADESAGDFAEVLAEAERLINLELPPPDLTWTHRVPERADRAGPAADRLWEVNLRPWIAGDGSYPPFRAGSTLEFALGYEPLSFERAETGTPHAIPLGGGVYQVLARVIYRTDEVCVLDFGVLAFRQWRDSGDAPPEWVREGTWLRADVALEIDAFAYVDWHCADPQMPAMIYRWCPERVVAEWSERIPASESDRARWGNPEMVTNHPTKRIREPVDEARPHEDRVDGSILHYYLGAERLPGDPTHQREWSPRES